MHLRILLRALLLISLGLTSACAHGGSGLFGGILGGGTNTGFKTKDLAGAWTGVLTPIPPPPASAPPNGSAVDPYPFYLRADAAGMPTDGADARGWDWSLGVAFTNAAVNSAGELLIELSSNTGVNALKMFGKLEASKLIHSGTYTISKHLTVIEQGTYVLTKSTGPGHFSTPAQLEGSWTGIAYRRANGNFRSMLLDLDSVGTVTGGELTGEHVFIPSGPNTGLFDFNLGDTEVGRLNNVVIQSGDGSTQTLHFVLVTEDGSMLGGPGTDSVLGSGIVQLDKVVPAGD
ncbi:MAG: hypothetical protein ISR76_09785 [Planctomycetes bacterium]|nr:hypothetical protein [Planctomycetota bacterium]MBL7009277.1 hypothetical protein [Planctomycetota bacterium]